MSTYTKWGEELDPQNVLQEYPRPQFVRESYQNLNGIWDYSVTHQKAAPQQFPYRILVPFSPEAPLSRVQRALKPEEFGWYRTTVQVSETIRAQIARGDHLVVNFGAVDQVAWVYVDGIEVAHHVGGYLPFAAEVPAKSAQNGTFEILVQVRDQTDFVPLSRGKQRTKRGGIWYTPQSGIWQTVWLEAIPQEAITRVDCTPASDLTAVTVRAHGTNKEPARAVISFEGEIVEEFALNTVEPVVVQIPQARPWSPETPHLYDLEIITGSETVKSYFAMRAVEMRPDEAGVPRLFLNGAPYFHAGVLDQGYWPDGLYTAPSDEAFVWDIQTMKDLGYNMLRKHIKVEPLRFYYHCDRIGMLVWQDMINGGSSYSPQVITLPVTLPGTKLGCRRDDTTRAHKAFGRADIAGRKHFESELVGMIDHLRNIPSIVLWVPFNEGWGQYDAARISQMVREIDPTRLIDHASGWHDQRVSDVRSLHVYFQKFKVPKDDGTGRALVLSEYGGYNYAMPGSTINKREFGYKKTDSQESLWRDFEALHLEQILPAVQEGLSAIVYTQLSDVEDELNGLVTYDRRAVKVPVDVTRKLNARIVSGM